MAKKVQRNSKGLSSEIRPVQRKGTNRVSAEKVGNGFIVSASNSSTPFDEKRMIAKTKKEAEKIMGKFL